MHIGTSKALNDQIQSNDYNPYPVSFVVDSLQRIGFPHRVFISGDMAPVANLKLSMKRLAQLTHWPSTVKALALLSSRIT